MDNPHKDEDPWQYATFEGAERLQYQQTAKMTFSERLQALDDMICLIQGLHNGKRHNLDISRPPKHSAGD
jgi:hypothetical protein